MVALGNATADVVKEPHFSDEKHSTEDRVSKLEQMVQKLSTENLAIKKKEELVADSFAKLYAALQV